MSKKRKDNKGRFPRTGESQRKDLICQYRHTDFRGKRHIFGTAYAQAGPDIKSLQYAMGHSDAGVTRNVYTHANYAHAADQMAKITEFRRKSGSKKKYVKLTQRPKKSLQAENYHTIW